MPPRKPQAPPKTIAEAAATGDRVLTLQVMRDKLARDMDEASPQVVAQVSARLQAVLAELAEIAAPKEASASDDLAAARARRRATANKRSAAGRSG